MLIAISYRRISVDLNAALDSYQAIADCSTVRPWTTSFHWSSCQSHWLCTESACCSARPSRVLASGLDGISRVDETEPSHRLRANHALTSRMNRAQNCTLASPVRAALWWGGAVWVGGGASRINRCHCRQRTV